MSEEIRIIKKYPNRRLYDTSISQYITLDVVKRLVLDHVEFKVIDAKTEKDLTHSTLMQIITEQEEQGTPILTTDLLRNIIRFYDNSLQHILGGYLEQSVSFFIEQQKSIRSRVTQLLPTKPLAIVSDIAERNLSLWKSVHHKLTKTKDDEKNS